MTLCPWERTHGEGHAAARCRATAISLSLSPPLTSSSLSQPTPFFLSFSSLVFFFLGGGGDYWPSLPLFLPPPVSLFSSPYQSSISILLTQFSSALLIFSFIFLPVSSSHLELSHRMLKSQWTGYKNMNSTSEKESLILSSFRLTGLVLIYQVPGFFPPPHTPTVWFQRHPAVRHLTSKNPKGHRAIKPCVIFFEVWTHDCHIFQELLPLSRAVHKACCTGRESKRILLMWCSSVWFDTFIKKETHWPRFARGYTQ